MSRGTAIVVGPFCRILSSVGGRDWDGIPLAYMNAVHANSSQKPANVLQRLAPATA